MMPFITQEDVQEFDKCIEWIVEDEEGRYCLREDAPMHIKDIWKRVGIKYESLPS